MKLNAKHIKVILQKFKYYVFLLLVFLFLNLIKIIRFFKRPKKHEKSIILIRLDAIGDYLLFRNFIGILRNSTKFKEYQIKLIGNIRWKNLAEFLDGEHINDFVWIDPIKYKKNLINKFKILKELSSHTCDILINPVYSRTFDMDFMIKNINAKEKIGNSGNLSNIGKWQKKISDKYYTKLLPATEEIIFEFYRNKDFFENLLEEEIKIVKPTIDSTYLHKIELKETLPSKYILIFLGAGEKFRKYSVDNWINIVKSLHSKYDLPVVLSGGPTEVNDSLEFLEKYNENIINLVNKTSLTEMIKIVEKSEIVLSNESYVPHLCVALNKVVIVVYNGNHFFRFIPYPDCMTNNYHAIYHPEIEKDLEDYKKLSNAYQFISNLNINEISYKKVINKVEEILKEKIHFTRN